jgi:CRP-like cAMP-binding protein
VTALDLDIAKRRRVEAGEVIFLEGQPGDKAYVILRGHAEVIVTTDVGTEMSIGRMGPGELFGELAILRNTNIRTATIIATDTCELLEIDRDVFDMRLGKSDPLLRFVLEHLTRRLVELTDKVAHESK